MSPDLYLIAVVLATVVATARLARPWTYDDFPPVVWVRDKFLDIADAVAPRYAPLGFCPWCCSPWFALALLGWADLSGVLSGDFGAWGHIWWYVTGMLSIGYLAPMLMARDGDDSDDDEPEEEAEPVSEKLPEAPTLGKFVE